MCGVWRTRRARPRRQTPAAARPSRAQSADQPPLRPWPCPSATSCQTPLRTHHRTLRQARSEDSSHDSDTEFESQGFYSGRSVCESAGLAAGCCGPVEVDAFSMSTRATERAVSEPGGPAWRGPSASTAASSRSTAASEAKVTCSHHPRAKAVSLPVGGERAGGGAHQRPGESDDLLPIHHRVGALPHRPLYVGAVGLEDRRQRLVAFALGRDVAHVQRAAAVRILPRLPGLARRHAAAEAGGHRVLREVRGERLADDRRWQPRVLLGLAVPLHTERPRSANQRRQPASCHYVQV